MTENLANLMSEFICNTIWGFESGLYKSLVLQKENINLIKTEKITFLLLKFNMNYYNMAYASLIRKDDQYIVEKFNEMNTIMNHSYICLLNILFKLTCDVIDGYDRTLFDTTSYENYMKSVEIVLDTCKKVLMENLPNMISHDCSGIDIKTCDPNKALFYTK